MIQDTMYQVQVQESKCIVLFGDIDRRRAFTECHASSSGGHQGRDCTEGRMKQYYWPSVHLLALSITWSGDHVMSSGLCEQKLQLT